MDQKRLLLFVVLSMSILIGWNAFVVPRIKPNKPAPRAAERGHHEPDRPADEAVADKPAAARDAEVGPGARGDAQTAETGADVPADEKPVEAAPAQAVAFPLKLVELGSLEADSGFRQRVTLTSQGAAVEKIELGRYPAIEKPYPPLAVVGGSGGVPFTLETAVPQVDAKSARSNWELATVEPAEAPHTAATFRLTSADIDVEKRYELAQVAPQASGSDEAPAYQLRFSLKFTNRASAPRSVNYELQGPTGVPLENVDNTQKFRDIVAGFVGGPGEVDHAMLSASAIADGKTEQWRRAFDYIGVDVQYFAVLICPVEDQRKTPYIKVATQETIGRLPTQKERTDISVLLTSVDIDLAAAGDPQGKNSVTHEYKLFAGPKHDAILPRGAEAVIDYGWFGFISRKLVLLLKGFHAVFGSWGIAIICLTVVVRGVMFPLSIKQARGAAKMQELQPELAALKEKYGKDKEKFARAQMELFSKHNYNPLAGCLPIFLQLPVFMGLYQALNHAVDLRMAKFLWIENLAAPDALFQLGFALPFLGWKEFNLLPFITIALFIVQQKMFMPPPANEEQAMQQKMMNFMMVFMGVMFYKVPAGLCVYFIASSLWGLAERKLLPKARRGATPPPAPPGGGSGGERRKPGDDDDAGGAKPPGLWSMLLKAADKETSARRTPQGKRK